MFVFDDCSDGHCGNEVNNFMEIYEDCEDGDCVGGYIPGRIAGDCNGGDCNSLGQTFEEYFPFLS